MMLIKDSSNNVIVKNTKFVNRDRSCWIENGIKFNGNQVIKTALTGVTNWNTSTPFSYNVIFRPTQVGQYQQILNNWVSSAIHANIFTLDLRLNGTLWVTCQVAGVTGDLIEIPYKVNEDIAITMTLDGQTLKAYKNGIFYGSIACSRIIGDSNIVNIGSVGNRQSYSYDGFIYDLKIFKKTLTVDEVFSLYNTRGKLVPLTALNDLLLNYDFEEKSGTNAYDKSGNLYNGTLENFTKTSLGEGNCHVDYTGQSINN